MSVKENFCSKLSIFNERHCPSVLQVIRTILSCGALALILITPARGYQVSVRSTFSSCSRTFRLHNQLHGTRWVAWSALYQHRWQTAVDRSHRPFARMTVSLSFWASRMWRFNRKASQAILLRAHYESTHDDKLLTKVIDLQRAVLVLRLQEHPERAFCCISLANTLHLSYALITYVHWGSSSKGTQSMNVSRNLTREGTRLT
jgi:hypothetical protein